jgi:uncharacterized membrane protein YidH (DUF202 family)
MAKAKKLRTREAVFSVSKSEFFGKTRSEALAAAAISCFLIPTVPFHFVYLGMMKSFLIRFALIVAAVTALVFGAVNYNNGLIVGGGVIPLIILYFWNLFDLARISRLDEQAFIGSEVHADEVKVERAKSTVRDKKIVLGAGGVIVLLIVVGIVSSIIGNRRWESHNAEMRTVFRESVDSNYAIRPAVAYNGAASCKTQVCRHRCYARPRRTPE